MTSIFEKVFKLDDETSWRNQKIALNFPISSKQLKFFLILNFYFSTHELRQELFKEGSLPANLVVEIPEYSDQSQAELCNEAIAYVADVETFGVIVYNFKRDRYKKN